MAFLGCQSVKSTSSLSALHASTVLACQRRPRIRALHVQLQGVPAGGVAPQASAAMAAMASQAAAAKADGKDGRSTSKTVTDTIVGACTTRVGVGGEGCAAGRPRGCSTTGCKVETHLARAKSHTPCNNVDAARLPPRRRARAHHRGLQLGQGHRGRRAHRLGAVHGGRSRVGEWQHLAPPWCSPCTLAPRRWPTTSQRMSVSLVCTLRRSWALVAGVEGRGVLGVRRACIWPHNYDEGVLLAPPLA